MTKFNEVPLRPQGQPWPGLNTRGGVLDPGGGFLEDGSINAIINESDLLEKRKGLVRGLDERFEGVVCGLFRYTDECGIEYVVVADEDGIKVRRPFEIEEFLGTDSIPFDDFEELSALRWSNTASYQVDLGALQLSLDGPTLTTEILPAADFMVWFKESALTSYYVEIDYRMVAQAAREIVGIIIKRSSDGNSYLMAQVLSDTTSYRVTLQLVINGVRATLASESLGGASLADGFLRLGYSVGVGSFTASARVIPAGGSQITIEGALTEDQASALGQGSAIGLGRADVTGVPEIESVSGGRV